MKIRYYGHVGVSTGYGHAANETCMAILAAGLDLEISTDGQELPARYLPLAACIRSERDLSPAPDVIIVHTLPLDCGRLLQGAQLRATCPRAWCIAYTTWEGVSAIPVSLCGSLALFDQVWAPSEVTADAFRVGLEAHRDLNDPAPPRAFVMPHAHDEEREWPHPEPLDADSTYSFLYVGAWSHRKNVEGLLRAYVRVFGRTDNVELVLAAAGANPSACEVAMLSTGVPRDEWPAVRLICDRLPEAEIRALHSACACFVTATRGEAWNLPAFDAMLSGRHIIAPRSMGHDDFLRTTNAALYPSQLAPGGGEMRLVYRADAPPGQLAVQYLGTQGMTVRSVWLEPCLVTLSNLMRYAYDKRISLLEKPTDPRFVYGYGRRAVGQLIRHLLEGERV